VRKRRKDAGQPRWEDRDYYVLQWISEQGVIRFDQLRRLLGRESPELDDLETVLSESATRNAIDRWETGHLVNSAHIVPKEPKYLSFDLINGAFLPGLMPRLGLRGVSRRFLIKVSAS